MSIQRFPALSIFASQWRATRKNMDDGYALLRYSTDTGTILIYLLPGCPPPNWWPEQDARPLPDEPTTSSEPGPEGGA